MDISKCLQLLTNLFSENARPTGEEHFMYWLLPILDELITLQVPEDHKDPTVFSYLHCEACRTAAQSQKPHIDLDMFIVELKTNIISDQNVPRRKLNHWN